MPSAVRGRRLEIRDCLSAVPVSISGATTSHTLRHAHQPQKPAAALPPCRVKVARAKKGKTDDDETRLSRSFSFISNQ